MPNRLGQQELLGQGQIIAEYPLQDFYGCPVGAVVFHVSRIGSRARKSGCARMRNFLLIAGVCALAAITASDAHATLINFDDASAPKRISSAPALTTKYSALGVTFSAEPGPYAGTPAVKILNQKSGFGVNARSGANFITYDQLTTGGVIMTFSQDVTKFSIWAGGRDYPDIYASFFDGNGSLLSKVTVSFAGPSYSDVSYTSPFRKVTISGESSFVMDDLSYTMIAVPEPASWTTMIVGLGLCGAMRRRRRR